MEIAQRVGSIDPDRAGSKPARAVGAGRRTGREQKSGGKPKQQAGSFDLGMVARKRAVVTRE
jgi:hypothetical protein